MIDLFKQKSPANIVLLLIFGLLIKMPLFLHPQQITPLAEDGKLYHAFVAFFTPANGSNAFSGAVISFFLLYGQALLINYIVNEQRMTNKQTFLPAMAYLLITSLFPEWNYLSAALLSSVLIMWAFTKLFTLYNAASANTIIFNIGLILGVSSFIYFPSVAFVLCLFLGLMILRPFRINELVLLVIGILTPYYFYSIYLFLNDQLVWTNVFPVFSIHTPDVKSTIWVAVAVVLLGVPFLLGGYFIQTHLRKMLIQARKNWSILLLFLLLALFIPFINSVNTLHNWVLVASSFAAFHASAYLYPQKRILPLLLFFLTLGFILFQQYGTNVWHQ